MIKSYETIQGPTYFPIASPDCGPIDSIGSLQLAVMITMGSTGRGRHAADHTRTCTWEKGTLPNPKPLEKAVTDDNNNIMKEFCFHAFSHVLCNGHFL